MVAKIHLLLLPKCIDIVPRKPYVIHVTISLLPGLHRFKIEQYWWSIHFSNAIVPRHVFMVKWWIIKLLKKIIPIANHWKSITETEISMGHFNLWNVSRMFLILEPTNWLNSHKNDIVHYTYYNSAIKPSTVERVWKGYNSFWVGWSYRSDSAVCGSMLGWGWSLTFECSYTLYIVNFI